jgi:hypothetical protein
VHSLPEQLPLGSTRLAVLLNLIRPSVAEPPMLLSEEKDETNEMTALRTVLVQQPMEPDSSNTMTMFAEHCLLKTGLTDCTQLPHPAHLHPHPEGDPPQSSGVAHEVSGATQSLAPQEESCGGTS